MATTSSDAIVSYADADRSLAGRVAVVTGGSRGIGAGIVERLAARGAAVAFTFNREEAPARALEAMITARGQGALAAACDVTESAAVTSFLTMVTSTLGPVDILVNNAGIDRKSVV